MPISNPFNWTNLKRLWIDLKGLKAWQKGIAVAGIIILLVAIVAVKWNDRKVGNRVADTTTDSAGNLYVLARIHRRTRMDGVRAAEGGG